MDLNNIKDTYKNHNTKWLNDDNEKLVDMIKNKTLLDDDISLEFGRTKNAVKCQILKILYDYYSFNENDKIIDDGLCCINIDKDTFIMKYNQNKQDISNRKIYKINKIIKEQNKTKTIQEQIEELNQKLDLIIKRLDTLEIE
tara:strand:- start:1241 stop:1666 length:426 start_codon:yes stop_codon:yes gene_type:complete